jgi:hypothetical protein
MVMVVPFDMSKIGSTRSAAYDIRHDREEVDPDLFTGRFQVDGSGVDPVERNGHPP